MRTPGLRLRQVFEHGTHFKVQKPGGQTITIAKKGLSPSTVGRLRRFAQGGEVRGYDDGGEVVDPSQADFEAAQAEVAASQQAADIATLNAQRYAEEQAAMQPVQAAPRRVVTVASNEAAQQQTPAQPTIIINNTPAPTAQPQAMTAEPAPKKTEEPAAPKEAPATVAQKRPATPVAIEEVPLPPSGVVPEASVSPVFVKAPPSVPTVPAAPPIGRFLSQPGLLAPLPPTMTPDLPKTEAPVEAAPAAAPAVPVAPAGIEPVAFKPVTGQQVVSALASEVAANPRVTVADVVTKLAGPGVPVSDIVQREIGDLPAYQLLKNKDLFGASIANIADEVNAIYSVGRADLEAAKLDMQELKEQEAKAAEEQKRDIARKEDIHRVYQDTKTAAEAADDIKPFFSSGGIGSTIGNIIALAVGGFMSGYTGTPNYVYDAYSKAAARDLQEQKRRRDSLWSKTNDILKDEKATDLLIQSRDALLTSIAIKKNSLQQNMLGIQPKLDKLAADFMGKAIQGFSMLDLHMAEAEKKREPPAPKVVRGGVRGPAAGKKTGAEIKHEEWETGRVFGIGGIPVKAPSATGMTGVRENLANRNQAISALDNAVNALESLKPGEGINVLSPERQKALTEVALQIENFPLAFGFKRAVSKVAKDQLKEAIANPLGIVAFLKEMFGDVSPAIGMKQLRDDTVSARENFVKNQAQADSRREQDAAEYGLWKQRVKELERFRAPIPIRPKLRFPVEELERLPDEPVAASAPSAKTFTITSTKTGQSRQTTDASMADRFRNQPDFTVVP